MTRLHVFKQITGHGFVFGLMFGAGIGALYGFVCHLLFALLVLLRDGWEQGGVLLISVIGFPLGLVGGLFIGVILGSLAGLLDGVVLSAITAGWFFPLRDSVTYHRAIRLASSAINAILTWLIAPILAGYLAYPRIITTIIPTGIVLVCTWKMIIKVTEEYEQSEHQNSRTLAIDV